MAILCPRCGNQYDVTLFEFGRTVTCDCGAVVDLHSLAPVRIPVEVKDLIRDYLDECLDNGILTVHSTLKKIPEIASFELARGLEGGWGATIIRLKKPAKKKRT